MSNRKTCMHMLGALRAEMESRSTRGGIGYETSTDVILRDSGNGCELRSLRSFVEYYGTFVSQHATNLRQRIEGAMNRVRQIKQARDAETNLLYVEAKIARRQLERIARERTAADIAKDKDFEKMEAEILSARFVGAGAASSQPARMADGSDDAAGSADMGADVPAAPAAAPPFRAQEGGEAGAGLSVRASLPRAAKQRGAIGAGQSAEQMTAPPASDEHAAAPPAAAEPTPSPRWADLASASSSEYDYGEQHDGGDGEPGGYAPIRSSVHEQWEAAREAALYEKHLAQATTIFGRHGLCGLRDIEELLEAFVESKAHSKAADLTAAAQVGTGLSPITAGSRAVLEALYENTCAAVLAWLIANLTQEAYDHHPSSALNILKINIYRL